MSASTAPRGNSAEHRDEWRKLRAAGTSYREIGERYGFSHEAVRLVVDEDPGTRAALALQRRRERAAEIRAWVEANPNSPREVLLAHFEITSRQLIYFAESDPEFPSHLILQFMRTKEQTYSDEEVSAAMERVWAKIKDQRPSTTGMAHVTYDKFRDAEDPSAARLIGRFGSWTAACEKSGVPDGNGPRPTDTYRSRWTDEQVLAVVADFVAAMGAEQRPATYNNYDVWQRGRAEAPSGTLIRLRMRQAGLTKWPVIVQAAMGRTSTS